MAWDNASKFASKHGMSLAKVPETMPQAMQFVLTFGKYEGSALSNIVKVDPGYILYLLKTPKPSTDPVYAAAKLLKVIAERTLAQLESIGNNSPPSSSMDELWPRDGDFPTNVDDFPDTGEHEDWGCRDDTHSQDRNSNGASGTW